MNDEALRLALVDRGLIPTDGSLILGVNTLLTRVKGIDFSKWSDVRRTIAAKQYICQLYFHEQNVDVPVGDIDGLVGHLTKHAFETYERMHRGESPYTRPETPESVEVETDRYVINHSARAKLPTQADMISYYGQPGSNQVQILLPFPLRLSWEKDKTITKMTCHKLAADEFSSIFEHILNIYGLDEIRRLGIDLWGGTLNVRKMRGGKSWSTHSWGTACDLDPDRNGLNTPWSEAQFSKPEYIPFINSWLSFGWVSLGLEHNRDGMHFQRAVIRR